MIDSDTLNKWFSYQAPEPDQTEAMIILRKAAKDFALMIHAVCPESADKTAAIRKLRECVTTANQSIMFRGN